jgi:hypothetical protein
MKRLSLIVGLAFLVLVAPAMARGSDVSDFRVRGIYVGMPEKQVQEVAGELERVRQDDFKELNNDRYELYTVKRDHDTLIAFDRASRKVMFVMGNDLTREGSTLFVAGDYQFRAQLGLMPMHHDDDWIFHEDRFNIAIQFTRDATKTAPTVARIILEDPSVGVKGGWLGGIDPRPGPKNDGPDFR